MTPRRSRARFVALAAIAILSLLVPASVAAHAELLETVPAADATVEGTPEELSATFSEALVVDGSSFSIRNDAGERLAVGAVDAADPTRLVIEDIPDLAPGTYEMQWQAKTADQHIERDTWSFTVAAASSAPPSASAPASPSASVGPSASAGATVPPTPEATPVVTTTPSGPITPEDDPAASSAQVFLPIVAGLALVLVAAALLLSRRGRPSGPK